MVSIGYLFIGCQLRAWEFGLVRFLYAHGLMLGRFRCNVEVVLQDLVFRFLIIVTS